MTKSENKSPLLELLNQRKAWNFPPYQRPRLNENEKRRVGVASRQFGAINKADPFATARMRLHLLQGFHLLSDVEKAVAPKRQANAEPA